MSFDSETEGRRIQEASIRFIRGARKVDIFNPDACLVEISGGNGAGKSSVLDAIEWGMRGKRGLPVDPLHHGATAGSVVLQIGDIKITRKINEGNAGRGGTAKIEAADGRRIGEKDLAALFGAWTFDPWAFSRLRPEEQVSTIRQLAGDAFCGQLAELEETIEYLATARTEAGRDLRRYGTVEVPVEVAPVDVGAMVAELQEVGERNEKIAAQGHAVQEAAAQVDRFARLVGELEGQLATARKSVEEWESARAKAAATLEALGPKLDAAPIQQRLASAGEINAQAQRYELQLEVFQGWQERTREAARIEADLEDAREARRQLVRSAELPVEGLSWEGGAIALHGTPFSGLCTTEKLLLSARIGMQLSPDLRVMMIREGGLIDSPHFGALVDLARREGYQLLVETAGDGHTPDALVISEGVLSDDEWGA